MKLNKDFREFIELLNSHEVLYLLIGGWSVALYGRPRYTKDIDFSIEASPSNARSMMRVLKEFGFDSLGLSESDFSTPDQIVQLGVEPHRIDIITMLQGVEFEDAWDRKVTIQIEDLPVYVISRQDLISNKVASGRAQDLADAEILQKMQDLE